MKNHKINIYIYVSFYSNNQDFMANPHSGMKESKIVLSSDSSEASSLPSLLILANKGEWLFLINATNLDSNLEIYAVTILSK